MFLDLALHYDPARGCCDLVFTGQDLALDRTPITPMLVSLGSDRRARADDDIPHPDTDRLNPASLLNRRGWAGDALDGQARRIGSRLWLLVRRKQTEAVRQLAESIVAEALGWLETERTQAVAITVRWIAAGRLGILAQVGATQLQISRAL